jgi:ribosome-associated protein
MVSRSGEHRGERAGSAHPAGRVVLALFPVDRLGGQSVNTTDSRAELSFNVAESAALPPLLKQRALRVLASRLTGGVITVTAAENRSQLRNREAAAARLSELLTQATAAPPKTRRPTRPTKGSTERRLAAKQRRSQIKRLRRSNDD